MKKLTVSISALFLAMGVLSGCGEKKEEAPKAEAPAAQEGMAGMGGMAGQGAAAPAAAPAAQEGMAGMGGMAGQAAGAVDGEKVFKGLCFSCHDTGVAGAPKMGDKADWGPRIAKGADALYKSAIEGRNNVTPGKVMPAKGGNPALSDAEVKAAVDYMMSQNK